MSPQAKRHTSPRRIGLRLVLLFVALLSLSTLSFAQDEQSSAVKVVRMNFPVTLADGNTYNVAGYLYYRGSFRNRTLQLALHGGNYNHNYWDVPSINGHEYSFARYMAERKYDVLAIDQLGAGESDKPAGDAVTLDATASAIHQVIARLRGGDNDLAYAFPRVVVVGHSLGSINAIYEQATYHDADAVVTTGIGHVPHELPIPGSVIFEMLQHEYFPFPDALRGGFYYAPDADPAVIDYDRANLADLLARGQLVTGILNAFDPSANRVGSVTGPVLVQLGEHDALFPSIYADGEAAYYTSAASVTVQPLPAVGHDVNTHLHNHTAWQLLDDWLAAQGLR